MRGRVARWTWWVAGVALLFTSSLVAAFLLAPSVARSRAISRARARGIVLEVGRVRVRWRTIVLADARVSLEGFDGARASAREISIGWSLRGLGDVLANGIEVELRGTTDQLRDRFAGWKSRHPSQAAATDGPAARSLRARDAKVSWTNAGSKIATGTFTELALDGPRITVRGGGSSLEIAGHELRVSGVDTEYSRATGLFGSVSASQVVLTLGDPGTAETTTSGAVAGASAIQLWRQIDRIRAAIEHASRVFEPEVELRADEVIVTGPHGTLGPWGARIILGKGATSFEVEPSSPAKGTAAGAPVEASRALVMRALVPRARGKWSAEVKFGPARLAELGVKEGSFGLVDVITTTAEVRGAIEVDPDEQTLAADGSLSVKGGAFSDPRVADTTVTGIDLAIRGILASKGDLTAWTLSGASFEVGKIRLEVDGGIEPPGADGKTGTRVWANWTIPTVPCSDGLKSLPPALIPKLAGMDMQGTFGAHGRLGVDTKAMDKAQVDFFLDQHCQVTKAPAALAVQRFQEPFDLRVYDPKGNPRTAKFGPGTAEWTPYGKISQYVFDAVLTCEDGMFFSHTGFSPAAIRNALIANLKAGKFAVGASTVTMQLAKNLFLERRKQLSRKLQELILTAWLEQSMSKREILELYLNVIEFGPNLYGIGPAAWHYFGRPASELDPLEATFLISILPSPVKRHGMWDVGSVGDGYRDYLRSLLKEELRRGKLEDEEYQAAVAEPLVFHRPGTPLPPSRTLSPKGGPFDKKGIDDGFDPVWAPAD